MTSLQQSKGFEARISLFKSLDCPLALAAAGRNQRFTRYPPVINHNQGWCNSGQNRWIFVPRDLDIWRMTLKTIRHLFCAISSFVHHFITIEVNSSWSYSLETPNAGQNQWFFTQPCFLTIWWMTLQNNRTHLLWYSKLSSSFHSHWSIQTGGTVWKHKFWRKSAIFCPVWPWNLTDDLQKQ